MVKRVDFIDSTTGRPNSVVRPVLEREPATGPAPRYAVDYASHGSMRCPLVKGGTSTYTRYFVDRVLKIKKGEQE